MLEQTQIERMSVDERMRTIEQLWGSLTQLPESVNSPDWHAEILDERRERAERGDAAFLTLEQLRARLRTPEK